MRAHREITFELTDQLRDRIYAVRSDADAEALLRNLGVRGKRMTGEFARDFKYIAGCLRFIEQVHGSAPYDFSGDPLLSAGYHITSEAKLRRRLGYERPIAGIRVLVRESSSSARGVRVLPLRAEPNEVAIPEGVTKMDAFSFMGCTRIQKVTIPSTLREIPAGAFWGCSGLRSFVVPEGVTSIGPGAFACCENLRRVVLPASLEHVGGGAFRGCKSLEEVFASEGFAVSSAAHVFDDCKLPADRYCRQADQPADKRRALEELDELLCGYTDVCLNGPNSVHSFMIEEVDVPDQDDVDELAGDAEVEVHRMLESAVDSCGTAFSDDYLKATRDDLLFLSRLIVDTRDSISGSDTAPKAYECSSSIWDECEKQCFIITGAIVVRAGDEWYALYAEWSD